jgi:hypothetical protein
MMVLASFQGLHVIILSGSSLGISSVIVPSMSIRKFLVFESNCGETFFHLYQNTL